MKNKIIKPPKPETCDSCFIEGDLRWDNERQEWLCIKCSELLRNDERMLNYANGRKDFDSDTREW